MMGFGPADRERRRPGRPRFAGEARLPLWVSVPCAAVWLAAVSGGCYHAVKPLPKGLSYRGEPLPASEVRFLSDETWAEGAGERRFEQRIFDEALALVAGAERLLVVDMFLFNEFLGDGPPSHRRLCEELTAALTARKRARPELRIVLITDPLNSVYGGVEASHLRRLEKAGVEVVVTRLDRLRDSNAAWSSVWRLLFKPWGNCSEGGWVSNPFGAGEVTVRSWLELLNFKANHRKVVVAEAGGVLRALVTSANPHDGSSAHSNVGIVFGGPAARDVLETEQAVLAFSGGRSLPLSDFPLGTSFGFPGLETSGGIRVQVLSEEAIADAAEALIGGAAAGDGLDLVMFYLADRRIVRALKAAARRGVSLRVVLDPNKDAFGRRKNGMPNRQVARELAASGVPLRWAATTGEQMHAKMLLVRRACGTGELLLGSANFTRRNVRDYNLETDVRVSGRLDEPALAQAAAYVGRLWTNAGGRAYTTGYESFRDDSRWRVIRYRLMEATGLCTW